MTQPTYLSVPDTPRSLGCNVHIGKLSLPVIVFFCLITLLHLPLYTLLLLLTSHKKTKISTFKASNFSALSTVHLSYISLQLSRSSLSLFLKSFLTYFSHS